MTLYQNQAASQDYAETMATHHSALGERTGGNGEWSTYKNTGSARVYFEWLEPFAEARTAGLPAIALPKRFRFYTK